MEYQQALKLVQPNIEEAQVSSRSKHVTTHSTDVVDDGDLDFRNKPKKLPVLKFENH